MLVNINQLTFILAGASQFVFHLEAVDNDINRAAELIQEVGAKGMLGGVAIKPGTPVDGLLAVMDKCAQLNTPGEILYSNSKISWHV